MIDRVQIAGFDELAKTLAEMGRNRADKAMRDAIREHITVFENDLKATAPQDSGSLARSMQVKISRDKVGGVVGAILGHYYGRFVEFGHRIVVRDKSLGPNEGVRLHVKGGGRGRVIGFVEPNDFIARSFGRFATAVQQNIVASLQEKLLRQFALHQRASRRRERQAGRR